MTNGLERERSMSRKRHIVIIAVFSAVCILIVLWITIGTQGLSISKHTPIVNNQIGITPTMLFWTRDVSAEGTFDQRSGWRLSSFPRRNWERVFVIPSLKSSKAGPRGEVLRFEVRLPLWVVAAALAAVGYIIWCVVPRKTYSGMCSKCGYNICGIRSEVCPECGQSTRTNSKESALLHRNVR